jgi:DNA modification methylase
MQDKANKLYNVDNIEFLRTLPDNSVSSIITDCPYGLQDIDALKLIKENTNNTRGFMNKAWDCLPTVDFLKECNRV